MLTEKLVKWDKKSQEFFEKQERQERQIEIYSVASKRKSDRRMF
jgi:hypothetical protein